MATVFGLSLGNYQGVISVYKNGRTEVLANESGERETPMLVTYKEDAIMVGSAAKGALYRNIHCTATGMPSLLTVDLEENEERRISNVTIIKKAGIVCYKFERERKPHLVPVKDALEKVLEQLAVTARSCESVTESIQCVLSVPINYSREHATLLRQCVESKGFTVISTPLSPMLSLLPYNLDRDCFTGHVVVYDIGVESVTITVVQLVSGLLRLLGTHTAGGLGGYTVDQELLTLLKEESRKHFRKDITSSKYAINKLLSAAESLKHSLSTQQTGAVYIESLHEGMDFQCNVSRGRLEGVCQSIFASFLDPIRGVLDTCGLTGSDINKVILVGGSCKIPRLQQMMKDALPNSEIKYSISTDHVVALGAVLEASYRQTTPTTPPTSLSSTLPCTSNDILMTFSNCTDPASVKLVEKLTPLPVCKTINAKIKVVESDDPVTLTVKENFTLGQLEIPPLTGSDVNENILDLEVKFLWNSNNGLLNNPLLTVKEVGSNWKSELVLPFKN